MEAKIIAPGGAVRVRPIPEGFIFTALCVGHCRGCGGKGRREFPMPERHPKRNPAIDPRACHDCNGTGEAYVWEGSRIAAMLDAVPEAEPERHESVRLFTPAPNQISGQLSL